ncbi:DNA polymerase-3 subunit delta' [Tangfeifania diversioriginum]|uniref:DNA polymerase-3 subunit delta n=1 Tax=Tangfeifania diversioriginum TaxID=1168035 RepID=A0A1M6F7H4_9BACT|nr:DNA polymerase III subunit delta [Tangfeifania diversioriginum]SHI93606.1 DNA polymerase-3 subunit delta' [Tangfeifania diversioriginum]
MQKAYFWGMFFNDVIGQEEIKKRLIRSVKEQRISHAQLFTGPAGTGKLALALAFAQYVSCRNRGETDSCGECPSCRKYQKMAHPDLHFVFPVFPTKEFKKPVSDDFLPRWREMVKKNPYFTLSQWLGFIENENAQGLIYERESDSIMRKLNLKSFESEYKVMIIWLPEKMHQACSNKLLKLIEEPPNKTLFLLVSEDEESIITTIRSRAQLLKVPFIDKNSMKSALEKIEGIDKEQIPEAVHLASGNYIKALEYLNPDEDTQFYFTKFQEMMRFAYKREVKELVDWAEEMGRIGRDRQKSFFSFALRLVREYFVMNMKKPNLVYLNNKERNWGKNFAPFINERNIVPFAKEFERGIKHISMNGNARIIFLDTALRMVRLIKR